MSESTPDGGPAFPNVTVHAATTGARHGMSLHDYFAGQALAGYLADPASCPNCSTGGYGYLAGHIWRIANAMLVARAPKTPELRVYSKLALAADIKMTVTGEDDGRVRVETETVDPGLHALLEANGWKLELCAACGGTGKLTDVVPNPATGEAEQVQGPCPKCDPTQGARSQEGAGA